MAAIQKINHLRVVRLVVNGVDVKPVEAPAPLPEDATFEDIIEAHNGLLATLTAAGIVLPQETEAK